MEPVIIILAVAVVLALITIGVIAFVVKSRKNNDKKEQTKKNTEQEIVQVEAKNSSEIKEDSPVRRAVVIADIEANNQQVEQPADQKETVEPNDDTQGASPAADPSPVSDDKKEVAVDLEKKSPVKMSASKMESMMKIALKQKVDEKMRNLSVFMVDPNEQMSETESNAT